MNSKYYKDFCNKLLTWPRTHAQTHTQPRTHARYLAQHGQARKGFWAKRFHIQRAPSVALRKYVDVKDQKPCYVNNDNDNNNYNDKKYK